MQNIQKLLNDVTLSINSLKTAKELYLPQLAPDFCVFDYVKTDELGLSKILADLLNPKGSHGQRNVFLQQFITICLPNLAENRQWQQLGGIDSFTSVDVKIEEVTNRIQSQRRMDIYLDFKFNNTEADSKGFGICIENKPYACDQENQLQDYASELEKRHDEAFHIVYLNEYAEPTEYSASKIDAAKWKKNNQFTWLRFSKLIDWLAVCREECKNNNVSVFLQQFERFITKEFMGIHDMSEQNAIKNLIIQNDSNLISALQVASNIDSIYIYLIDKLNDQLINLLDERPYKITNFNMNENKNKYQGIECVIEKYGICLELEFQASNFNYCYLGCTSNDQNIHKGVPIFDENSEKLKTLMSHKKNVSSSKMWLLSYNFEAFDWGKDVNSWIKIQDGSMAQDIVKAFDEMYEVLVQNDIKLIHSHT